MSKIRRLTVNESKSKVSSHRDLEHDVEQLKNEIVEEVVTIFRDELTQEMSRIVRHNGVEEVRLGDEAVLWLYGHVIETKNNDVKITYNYTRALTTPEEEEAKDFWTQAPMGTFGT
jgi:hypothetical protein